MGLLVFLSFSTDSYDSFTHMTEAFSLALEQPYEYRNAGGVILGDMEKIYTPTHINATRCAYFLGCTVPDNTTFIREALVSGFSFKLLFSYL